ncbi:MAG: Ni/Fe-hydrogenase, b-type cytochrome subunit [Cellulomonadaceae bacterium]|jgi:Ni/Fe-hydrogenase b-type cytochrome subunit|nr:Ni/Fe-hydrogenase, b-type cytochrome subunit [Cellulomonadaceae bacterium]
MSTPTDTEAKAPTLVVGPAFSLGEASEGRIMELAAACVEGSNDPVDAAAVASLADTYQDADPITVPEDDFKEPTAERRYSLARIRNAPNPDGTTSDVVVARGDLQSVLQRSDISREKRDVLKLNADRALRRGYRPLAIARANVAADDSVGPFTVLGFVPVGLSTSAKPASDLSTGKADYARVPMWSVSVRIQHWTNALLILTLSATGFYIMDPFFGPEAYGGEQTLYLMGWIRLVHFVAAFGWISLALWRLWLTFFSKNRYLRWPALWPLKSREDFKNLGRQLQHYVLWKKHAPMYLGHNPLQQLAYTAIYALGVLQIATGLVLYGLFHQQSAFWHVISMPSHWIGVPWVRLIHAIIMFCLWAFVIIHVYLVFRADSLERHGGLSAMVSGGVWVKRGTTPVDGPTVE